MLQTNSQEPENNNDVSMQKDGTAAEPRKSFASDFLDYVEIFVFAICFVILIFTFAARLCIVKGPSMEKTLNEGELLIVSNLFYEPERGDIIVFHQTGILNEPVVKRVIATGGETIDIDFSTWTVTVTHKDGTEEVLNEPYMYLDRSAPLLTSSLQFPYEIPEGYIFVMGDNRNHSTDSRGTTIGLVDSRRVLGKVLLRVSPFSKFGTVD